MACPAGKWRMATERQNGGNAGKSRREARLAAALRENLRRRKAQERGRTQADEDSSVRPGEGGHPGTAGR
jgi:hypothetical protein